MNYCFLGIIGIVCFSLTAEEPVFDKETCKRRISLTAQKEECFETIRLYREYRENIGRDDFEILHGIASTWIEQSAKSPSPQARILGLFGFGIAGLVPPYDILEAALVSQDPGVQHAALQYLGGLQEDFAETLLNKAMSSSFLYTRLEAAFYLAGRKSKTAAGQIEALMYRLPPPMRYFFPEFFAMIGTGDAIAVLRNLMDDSFPPTKAEAILSAARHGRDDLLPSIRACAGHTDFSELEAGASALGYLQDLRSKKRLKKLTSHSSPYVRIAACNSLRLLGSPEGSDVMAAEAKEGNLFAIALAGEFPDTEDWLAALTKNEDRQIRFNATVSLLKKKDPRALSPLLPFLIKDIRDIGFRPATSPGGSLQAWKTFASTDQQAQDAFYDVRALTLAVKEHLLEMTSLLPDTLFEQVAESLFLTEQNDLVPRVIAILTAKRSEASVSLLKKYALKAGAPLIRAYCNLALFTLSSEETYRKSVIELLQKNGDTEILRLRASLPWNMRLDSRYSLTPEETSALIIGAYQALLDKQDPSGIDLLLDGLATGHRDNRPVLSGILLRALQ